MYVHVQVMSDTVKVHCCVVLVIEVLEQLKFTAAGLTINSKSRMFQSGDLSQLVQQTKLT